MLLLTIPRSPITVSQPTGQAAKSWVLVRLYPEVGMNAMGGRMPAHASPPRYGAYLLRCWKVRSDRPGQPAAWHFSLEQAGTGKRRRFRDLGALVAHLEQELRRDDFGSASAQENEKE
jgi:hypothetical protein